MCEYELPTSRLSEVTVWQTERQTRPELYTAPLRGWSIKLFNKVTFEYCWSWDERSYTRALATSTARYTTSAVRVSSRRTTRSICNVYRCWRGQNDRARITCHLRPEDESSSRKLIGSLVDRTTSPPAPTITRRKAGPHRRHHHQLAFNLRHPGSSRQDVIPSERKPITAR